MSTLAGSLDQTWPPFVLIAGLLLIGVVAASDRLFEATGAFLARLPGGGFSLFASLMTLVAVVTVVLNLDTSVVFLTPILLHAARRRRLDETAFLYGTVFMSNSASLLLPGSNLTNLLVVHGNGLSGRAFALRMAPAWLATVAVTMVVLVVWRRKDLGGPAGTRLTGTTFSDTTPRWGAGVVGVAAATILVLTVANPAIPVLVLGVMVVGVQLALGRLSVVAAVRSANPMILGGLFLLATGLGVAARTWGAPGRLMAAAGATASAWIGVGASCLLNNLPAAVLLSSRTPAHPSALLIGLDLGPNLVATGSLAAIFWLQVARAEGARPSVRTYSLIGVVLVPLSVFAALGALAALTVPTS